jgi:hypothetical protein
MRNKMPYLRHGENFVKTNLLLSILAVAAIGCLYVFTSPSKPKLLNINIIGPDSVPENTQNVFYVVANYDNGSKVEVTVDAGVKVVSRKCKVANLGGIVETFKLEQQKRQFTIHAKYQNIAVRKLVTVYRNI